MSLPSTTSAPKHIARLDVVRALAFLSVYAFHLTGPFGSTKIPFNGLFKDYSGVTPEMIPLVPISFGWLGVALFYVLSGFCIHYATLARAKPFQTRDFYWRRFLRIYPAYIVCVIVCSLLTPWLHSKFFNGWQVVVHVLMIHNFLNSTIFGINGVLWSLGVEMQFYLLYPLLILLAKRWMGLDRCLILSLVLNVVLDLYFSTTADKWSPIHTTWSFPLTTWCDWVLGACLADAYVRKVPMFPRPNLALGVSFIFLAAAVNYKYLNAQSFLFASVFCAVLLQRYLAVQAPLQWFERLLIPVGLISYSLYLWHSPIIILVDQWGQLQSSPHAHAAFNVVVTTAFLIPIAAASYYFLEIRGAILIRKFLTQRHLATPPLPGPAAEQPFQRHPSN